MNKCKDCKYWKVYKEYNQAECENQNKIHEDDYHKKEEYLNHDHLHYSYNEGGSFYPGANFGCIHWSPRT